jgi:hypothetical protein
VRAAIIWMVMLLLVTSAACRRGSDGTRGFTAVTDGVVRDARTTLEWTARDREQSLDWDEADRQCRGLALGGAHDWRLPELAELTTLYDPRFDEPCGDRRCRLDPAVRLGGPYVWTATSRGEGTRFYFDFSAGTSFSPNTRPQLVRRTLCVRGTSAIGTVVRRSRAGHH